jgi:predicted heme/steroid binding protein
VWPPLGGYRVLGFIRKPFRFVIGLTHIVAAFLWFGTILYVHMILKPAYAERGLPKGEVRLGMVSMFLVGLTGILLTISKIKSIDVLYSSPWGVVLSIKIIIFLVMVSSAAVIVLFVGPKLKERPASADKPADGIYDPLTLSSFNGTEGRNSFVAYKEKVYDVSNLKLWKNGKHMKHSAGTDLTDALGKAPHGFEKLDPLNVVGAYDPSKAPRKTVHQKIFYFVAYMNLVLVYIVLITISYWRWGM